MTLSQKLLDWYDVNKRVLPWRSVAPEVPNSYHVWLSEIMLQQTTVVTVIPYFKNFIHRWPTLEDLAQANLDDILHAWQGLGYYTRARNLYKCAQVLVREYGSQFPQEEKILRKLPGIGEYTAAAIRSIAFDKPATVMDGNVIRVISRLYAIKTPLPEAKNFIRKKAEVITPQYRCGDYSQAIMDLGATVCTPVAPKCLLCPLNKDCCALQKDTPEEYPVKGTVIEKPQKYGIAFWIERKSDHAVLLRKRPEKGLLGGMMEIPSSEWKEQKYSFEEIRRQAPVLCNFESTNCVVKHVFTHFSLELLVYKGYVHHGQKVPDAYIWATPDNFKMYAIPTVMKKIIHSVL